MEEEKKTAEKIDYETPLKRHKEQQRRNTKIDNIMMLAVATMFGLAFIGAWWWGTLREPIEFTYCGIDNSKTRAPHKCADYKLKIPFIYYGGYPLDFSRKVPGDEQSLEVAYPSMQPWHSLSMLEKWNSQKIEIVIDGTTTQTVKDLLTIDSLGSLTGTTPTSRSPEPIYGLVQYLDEPAPHYWQFLVPQEPNPRMYLECAYRASNPDVNNLGCGDYMFTEWGLKLELHHKLILLPHWSDIHDKVQSLIQSFVVNP
jgi:hypothetical protein